MADPQGFLHIVKKEARKRPVAERVHDWAEVYAPQSPAERAAEVSEQAARCMDCGIPFCHSGKCGLSAGQPDPGVERPGAPRPVVGGQRPAGRHEQLPGVHRVGVSGAVRVGVRAVDRRESTAGASPSSASSRRSPTTRGSSASWSSQPAAISTVVSVAVVGVGVRGDRVQHNSSTRAGHHVTVYERDNRIGGLMRYGIPEYKLEEVADQSAPGADAGRGHAIRHRLRGRRRPERRGPAC